MPDNSMISENPIYEENKNFIIDLDSKEDSLITEIDNISEDSYTIKINNQPKENSESSDVMGHK